MKKIIKPGVILLALLIALTPTVAFALGPPTDIIISSVQAVRNTVVDGDLAIAFYFNTVYVDYPDDVPASEAVILRLYKADGTTLLQTASPYTLFDYGYGPQVSGFYFNDDEVEDLGLESNLPYIINVTYSEAFLESPQVKTYTLTSADYCTSADPGINRALMASWVLAICEQLEAARPSYLFHGSTDVGIVLTDIGEAYFRGAIPGIQSIAPSLFFLQFITPEVIDIAYTANMTTVYGGTLTGTDIEAGFTRLGAYLGTTGEFAIAMVFFACAIAMIIFTAYKGWGAEPGMMAGGNWLTMGALLAGNTVMVLRMVIALIAGIMLLYVLLFRRA